MVLVVAWGTIPALAAEAARGPVKVAAKAKAKQKKPSEPAAIAQASPVPLLPYQLPAQTPKVTFQNGQLAIVADNCTLAAVLEQVGVATGASVETSPAFGGERVSARLGPGLPRSVLADLLNGSSYNYFLLGSVAAPESLERIVVTQRGAPPAAALSTAPAPTRTFPAIVRQPPPQLDEESEIVPETDEVQEEPQSVPAETQPPAPQATPTPGQPGQPGAPPGTQTPPTVKTPQELLQELQERMRRHQEDQDRQREQQEEEPK